MLAYEELLQQLKAPPPEVIASWRRPPLHCAEGPSDTEARLTLFRRLPFTTQLVAAAALVLTAIEIELPHPPAPDEIELDQGGAPADIACAAVHWALRATTDPDPAVREAARAACVHALRDCQELELPSSEMASSVIAAAGALAYAATGDESESGWRPWTSAPETAVRYVLGGPRQRSNTSRACWGRLCALLAVSDPSVEIVFLPSFLPSINSRSKAVCAGGVSRS